MRTDLRHEEDFVAAAFEREAHPIFGAAVEILPTVVEKSDARVHRFVNEANGVLDALEFADVMAADPERRDAHAGPAERPHGDGAGVNDSRRFRLKLSSGSDDGACGTGTEHAEEMT